jgi:aspartyl-tRNA(Asn)/glutamyl-tRNA(Gln) amidotransferase subunit A
MQKCSHDVLDVYYKQLENLKDMGAELEILNFDFIDLCVPTYIVITSAEASANLARYDGIRYGYSVLNDPTSNISTSNINIDDLIAMNRNEGIGDEVVRRILIGTHLLKADNIAIFLKAKKLRNLIKRSFIQAFDKVDLFLLPASTTPAFKINAKHSDPVSMYLSDFFTTAANLAGIPAISLPLGLCDNNLPVGMQLHANLWEEEKLFKYAKALLNFSQPSS